ncbi:uncharacterized protein FOMMEDRAFT_159401 [Fomitiporia mediterranea MF3/22]|uniref:uncharacterized protein n=1 Tax=Fomitiporia mediterranea (strain MF3/22) TaxID=694068 RepID=UPI00044074DD|nr:uncharacterized protein FOMMEDRAFT_159401 [Fomitiporia mediterranea MF3/22]EJD00637.1 hypothetical protein FOMMEDRAFT_159401 [Fomitiporia mediterranea MF3/22]
MTNGLFDSVSSIGRQDAERRLNEEEKQDGEIQDEWEGKFIAVCARDTLELSHSEYSRKVQTTKYLERPWTELPGEHSMRKTLLLDDSPEKARLNEAEEIQKKTKQIKKKQQHLARITTAVHENSSEPAVREASLQEDVNEEFDSTLLAAMGILHMLSMRVMWQDGYVQVSTVSCGLGGAPATGTRSRYGAEACERMPSLTDVKVEDDERRPEEATAAEVPAEGHSEAIIEISDSGMWLEDKETYSTELSLRT